MFERIRGFFMNILSYFHSYTVEEITGVETNISADMLQAIELWNDMAAGKAPWNDKAEPCGILGQITTKLNMLVIREIALEVENEAIKPPMEHIDANIDKIVDYITLLGGCLIRPIFANGKLQYENLPLGNYLPTKYDFDGTLTGALLFKQFSENTKKFLLVEQHNFDGTNHSVKCTLYRIDGGTLRKASLADCKATAGITEEYIWQNARRPMIVEFRNHAINRIDGSNVPMALIAGAENLIEDADRQYERMNWEQEAGKKRLIADRDMFVKREKRNGEIIETELTPELNTLILQVEGDGSADGKKIVEWSPELRTEAQNAMLQQIFRRIELTCGIGKGTISDMESVQQTATQYSGGRQELFAIVDKIEDEIEVKYQACADIFAYMAAAYKIGANNPKITVTWNDDQTRKDMQQAKQTAMQEISAGVMNKWEYRAKFYGEDEATAKANTPEEPTSDFSGMFGGA